MIRAVLVLGLAGCALTQKAAPLDVRYYAPSVTRPPRGVALSTPKIRLGRVFAGNHLRSRIAYRASAVELQFYETRRWAESPEAYVRRAVERALFERGVLVTGGQALELEVEVIAFEELPRAGGRVALRYVLIDDRDVVGDGVIEVVQPAGDDFDSLVVAIGNALEQASARLVSQVMLTK